MQAHSTNEYCPSCQKTVDILGNHWKNSKSCSAPALSPQQEAILEGLLFTTGELIRTDNDAQVTFKTNSRAVANWVASIFGVLTETVESQDSIWVWKSHSTTSFQQIANQWSTEGTIQVPDEFNLKPETLRIIYAVIGKMRSPNGNQRPVLSIAGCNASVDEFKQLTRHFNPLEFKTPDQEVELYLNQTVDFFQYLGKPVPGRGSVWLTDNPPSTPRQETCPHCLHDFMHIETHWETSSTCTPPMLSWRQHELVKGILLGDGRLESAKSGYRLTVTHSSRRLLESIDDTFGILGMGVEEIENGFRWDSRASADFGRFVDWMDTDDTVHVPGDLHHTSEMLRVAYALSGTFKEGKPHFSVEPTVDSDKFVEQFFTEFDPICTPNSVVIRDVSAFFGYVGWIPLPGCETAWPNSS